MTERQLYRLVAGKQTGPYAPEKLRPLIADGRISRLDRFSYDGVDWLPADHFPALMTSGAPPSNTSTVSTVASATSTTASALPAHPVLASDTAPPPFVPPLPNTAATPSALLWRRFLVASFGIALLGALATGVFFMSKGSFTASQDVTDQFDAIVDSVDAFDGLSVVARGTYYANGLQPRTTGQDYTIKFCSGDTANVVVTGDCAYRLTLVAPEAMANKLKDVADRLAAEQPAALVFTCREDQSNGRKRPIGLVNRIRFFHEMPHSTNATAFLEVTDD